MMRTLVIVLLATLLSGCGYNTLQTTDEQVNAIKQGNLDYKSFFANKDSADKLFPNEAFEAPLGHYAHLTTVKQQVKFLNLD